MRYAVRRERLDPWDTDAPLYGQPGATHDVFDRDGVYLAPSGCPKGSGSRPSWATRSWGFRRGELDEIWIEAYERVAVGAMAARAGRP